MLTPITVLLVLAAEPLRLMPLGDSLSHPSPGSARYVVRLWEMLQASDREFLFVGSGVATYQDITVRHEGHSGWTSIQIADGIETWMMESSPDLVVFQIGHNDVRFNRDPFSTLEDIEETILKIQEQNPRATVLLAEVVRTVEGKLNMFSVPYNDLIDVINPWLPALAHDLTTPYSQVIFVPFDDWNPDIHTVVGDGLHPNPQGELLMASAMFDRIDALRLTHQVPALGPLPLSIAVLTILLAGMKRTRDRWR